MLCMKFDFDFGRFLSGKYIFWLSEKLVLNLLKRLYMDSRKILISKQKNSSVEKRKIIFERERIRVYVFLCKVYEMNGSETKAKLTVKSFVVFDLTSNRYRMIHKAAPDTYSDNARE